MIDRSVLGQFGQPDRGVILGASAVAVSCPADTNEDLLAAIVLPANTMGPHGRLRITTVWSTAGVAGSRTPRVRFGGFAGTAFAATLFNNANTAIKLRTEITNRGALNSQVGGTEFITNSAAAIYVPVTGAIDTALAQLIVITGQKVVGADTLTLEEYLVELFPS